MKIKTVWTSRERHNFLRFAPECKIESLHGSIMKDEYNRDWFKQFRIVLNALGDAFNILKNLINYTSTYLFRQQTSSKSREQDVSGGPGAPRGERDGWLPRAGHRHHEEQVRVLRV